MKPAELLKTLAVSILLAGSCLAPSLKADDSAAPSAGPADVELREGGLLLGQLVDQQGLPMADAMVVLFGGPEKLAETRTDARGMFAFQGLRGGVYQATAAGGLGAYRVWAPGTAPPSAQPGALLVAGEDLLRGQRSGLLRNAGSWLRFSLTRPAVLLGVTAAAVAIPVALHNADKGGPKSPP